MNKMKKERKKREREKEREKKERKKEKERERRKNKRMRGRESESCILCTFPRVRTPGLAPEQPMPGQIVFLGQLGWTVQGYLVNIVARGYDCTEGIQRQ